MQATKNSDGTLRITGTSLEVKPTANMPSESIFTETDTGIAYGYSGLAWVPGGGGGAAYLPLADYAETNSVPGTRIGGGIFDPMAHTVTGKVTVVVFQVSGNIRHHEDGHGTPRPGQ
jgi:hypothetical protein